MTSNLAEETVPSITLPESRQAPPAERHLRAVPTWGSTASLAGTAVPPVASAGPARSADPSASGAPDARRSRPFAPPSAPRSRRPFVAGGAPPTVIRDLDALFAQDRTRRSTPAPARVSIIPSREPMDPRDLASALLSKVERDFGKPTAPSALSPDQRISPSARFVPVVPTQRDFPTVELALPDDDEDLARLTPWYTRVWRALFGR